MKRETARELSLSDKMLLKTKAIPDKVRIIAQLIKVTLFPEFKMLSVP